jgi:hypothetical protein
MALAAVKADGRALFARSQSGETDNKAATIEETQLRTLERTTFISEGMFSSVIIQLTV